MVWLLLVAESQSTEGWLFALPFIGVVFDLVAWHQLDSIGTNHPQYPMNRNARGSVMAAIHDVAAPRRDGDPSAGESSPTAGIY